MSVCNVVIYARYVIQGALIVATSIVSVMVIVYTDSRYKVCNVQLTLTGRYSRHKSNCQKINPAHFMITKRVFSLRGSCFCEKYNTVLLQPYCGIVGGGAA